MPLMNIYITIAIILRQYVGFTITPLLRDGYVTLAADILR